MKRRLFNLAAAISLILAIAVGVLWVRSYARRDYVTRLGELRRRRLASMDGCMTYVSESRFDDGPVRWTYDGFPTSYRPEPVVLFQRFHYSSDPSVPAFRDRVDPGARDLLLTIPYWLVVLPLLILPGWWAIAGVLRHRSRQGRGFEVVSADASSMIQ